MFLAIHGSFENSPEPLGELTDVRIFRCSGLFSNEPCIARNIDSCGIAAAVVSISAGSTLGSVTCPNDDHSPCMSSNKHHLHNDDIEIHYRRN
jgi:hypothetical protein